MASLEELERKIKALEEKQRATEDIEEIKKLQYRYITHLINANWDGVMDCFAEDSKFVMGPKDSQMTSEGKAEIDKLFREFLCEGHYGRDCDLVLHPMITVDGDKAKGNWMLYQLFSYRPTGQALFWIQGTYDMEYIRVDGQWKISVLKHATLHQKPPVGHPPFPGV